MGIVHERVTDVVLVEPRSPSTNALRRSTKMYNRVASINTTSCIIFWKLNAKSRVTTSLKMFVIAFFLIFWDRRSYASKYVRHF